MIFEILEADQFKQDLEESAFILSSILKKIHPTIHSPLFSLEQPPMAQGKMRASGIRPRIDISFSSANDEPRRHKAMGTLGTERSQIGFKKQLFIMPFDHRGSFQEKLFGIKGRQPTAQETAEIASYKRIIFDGFQQAIAMGVPRDKAGILVDEQFGSEILKEAKALGFMTACPAEKSGQDEFDFEYGQEFGAHISRFHPTFVKVLVRYNPEGDAQMNQRQSERLKQLSEYCHKNQIKFMFELLVPATSNQLASVNSSSARFDQELRPNLMIRAMESLQNFGIEPDVWKLEGIETAQDSKRVAEQAQKNGRSGVGVIVLGRGENAEKVKHWLTTAAKVPGLIGFAVGRTIFWEPLKAVKDGKISKAEAVQQVAKNYKGFCDLWSQAQA
ncbi:MAG: 2-deoxy-5-keto-D-gluconate 6-phosphate aldolase domain-containing protein [Bdellovibrionia bacterium]